MNRLALIGAATSALCGLFLVHPAQSHEADKYMVFSCAVVPEVSDCGQQMTAFRSLYKAAYKNDINSQRELALLLWKGKSKVVTNGRWLDSCAWYMTIIALGSSKVTQADSSNMRTVCGLLRPDEMPLAKTLAREIGHRIIAGGKIDETISTHASDPKLDSTPHPF